MYFFSLSASILLINISSLNTFFFFPFDALALITYSFSDLGAISILRSGPLASIPFTPCPTIVSLHYYHQHFLGRGSTSFIDLCIIITKTNIAATINQPDKLKKYVNI